jgi:RNA 2',3'-cyclic 3'-phosphodiesterase
MSRPLSNAPPRSGGDTEGVASVRTFLAVNLAPEVHATLVALKQQLAAAIPTVRWVRDQALHATIKFLGYVPVSQIEPLRTAVATAVSGFAPFTVRARGLGAFPSPRKPRVVWVGLVADALPRLAAAVDAALEPLGFERERRPFRSHITLGRIDAPQAWAPLADALRRHVSDDFGSCRIDELVAYRSELQRTGAVYTRLWSIGLVESTEGGFHGAGCEE